MAKVLLLLMAICVLSFSTQCRADKQKLIHTQILSQYLDRSGEQFNCYFTIEEAPNHPGQVHSSYRQRYVPDTPVRSLAELVEKMKIDLPDALVVPDPGNPKVIHIINRELKAPGYAMDQSVTVAYQGDLPGLASAIGTKLNGAVEPGGISTTIEMTQGMDYLTQVHVEAQNLPVREILVKAIPLPGYNRILWRAVPWNNPDTGRVVMGVQFFGKPPPSLKSR